MDLGVFHDVAATEEIAFLSYPVAPTFFLCSVSYQTDGLSAATKQVLCGSEGGKKKIYGTKVFTAMFRFSSCSHELPSQTTARENTEDWLSLYLEKVQCCIVPTVGGLKGQPAASVICRGPEDRMTYGMT